MSFQKNASTLHFNNSKDIDNYNACSDTDRKDAYGNSIQKGSKSFRVSFQDEMKEKQRKEKEQNQKSFVKVIKVRSYKQFNKLDNHPETDEEESNEEDNSNGYYVISDEETNNHKTKDETMDKDEGMFSSCLFI